MLTSRRLDPMLRAAVLLVLALAPMGCGKSGRAEGGFRDTHPLPADTMTFAVREIGAYGGRFVIGVTSGPKTFNAMMVNETSSSDITSQMFASLTEFDNGTQQLTPRIAKSWETSPDGRTWTFHLRHGAAFSDGHPISSADVLFSFAVAYDSTLHPPVQDLFVMNGRKWEVSAPDSYTVVITTPSANGMVIAVLGSLRVLPRHVLEPIYQRGDFASAYNISTAPDSIVTSGPWRLKQNVTGEKTVLTRNPYWFGVDPQGHRLPYLDELVFLVVPDQDALDLKFRSGEVDGVDNPKPENYRWYEDNQKQGDFTVYDLGPGLSTNFFWFNLNRVRRQGVKGKKVGDLYVDPVKYAWFNNPSFRCAVSKAIDRDAMITSVFFGEGVKCWSTTTPGNRVWHTPGVHHDDYDPDGAKQLLAGLGWKDKDGDGFLEDAQGHTISFTMKTNSDNKLRVAMGNFIKDDLAKVGIKVILTPVDFNTLITSVRDDLQYESVLLGLQGASPPDPGMGQNVWRSSGRTHFWNINQPRPETPQELRMNQLVDTLVTTTDLAARKSAWEEIQNIANEQCWLEWLPTLKIKLPVRNRFGNLQPTVIAHRLLWNIDRVYVKARARA